MRVAGRMETEVLQRAPMRGGQRRYKRAIAIGREGLGLDVERATDRRARGSHPWHVQGDHGGNARGRRQSPHGGRRARVIGSRALLTTRPLHWSAARLAERGAAAGRSSWFDRRHVRAGSARLMLGRGSLGTSDRAWYKIEIALRATGPESSASAVSDGHAISIAGLRTSVEFDYGELDRLRAGASSALATTSQRPSGCLAKSVDGPRRAALATGTGLAPERARRGFEEPAEPRVSRATSSAPWAMRGARQWSAGRCGRDTPGSPAGGSSRRRRPCKTRATRLGGDES